MKGFIAFALIALLLVPCANPSLAETNPGRSHKKAAHVLDRIQKKVATTLNVMDANLARAATGLSKTGIAGSEARRIVRELCGKSPHAIDCATVDAKGTMVVVEPQGFAKFEGSDISSQEQIIRLHSSLKPVFSRVFRSVEGADAVDLEYPVFSQKNELLGSVSVLMKPSSLLWKPSHDEAKETVFEVRAAQKDGLILYSPNKDEIGKLLFQEAPHKDYPEFVSLIERISKEKRGTGTYRFIGKDGKTPLQEEVIWTTVGLHDTEWRIILCTEIGNEKKETNR